MIDLKHEFPEHFTSDHVDAAEKILNDVGKALKAACRLRESGRHAEGFETVERATAHLELEDWLPVWPGGHLMGVLLDCRSNFFRDVGRYEKAIEDVRKAFALEKLTKPDDGENWKQIFGLSIEPLGTRVPTFDCFAPNSAIKISAPIRISELNRTMQRAGTSGPCRIHLYLPGASGS